MEDLNLNCRLLGGLDLQQHDLISKIVSLIKHLLEFVFGSTKVAKAQTYSKAKL